MKKFEFIPIICNYFDSDKCNHAKITNKLKSSKIPLYFYGDMNDFETFTVPSYINGEKTNLTEQANKVLLQDFFSEAVQIIAISFDGFAYEAQYVKSANPKAIFKHIGDHEAKRESPYDNRWIYRSMGLTKNQYGIKIAKTHELLPSIAFATIEKNDKNFIDTVLKQTNTSDWNSFDKDNYFVLAFFHFKNYHEVKSFIKLLTTNQKLPKKNFAIYLSSNVNTKMLENLDRAFGDFLGFGPVGFEESDIKQIEIITPGNNQPKIYPINQQYQKVVRLFCGFDLCDESYYALFKCVFMAAISGDNTFERAIANETFLYYWSTNHYPWKSGTLVAIQDIIKLPALNIPVEVKRDLLVYFDPNKYPLDALEYKQLDLIAMAKAWPTVARFIKENYNFYNQLEAIFFEKLNLSLFPNQRSSTITNITSLLIDNKTCLFHKVESTSISNSMAEQIEACYSDTDDVPICIMQMP